MLQVKVFLMNDTGEELALVTEDETVDAAVAAAMLLAEKLTGDDSYVMNDWVAA